MQNPKSRTLSFSEPNTILSTNENCAIEDNNYFKPLTQKQIERYERNGILVLENVLSPTKLKTTLRGLHKTLLEHGVDTTNLRNTGHNIKKLSSTNGTGGVLDIFYPDFKMDIATNETLFRATSQLWDSGEILNLLLKEIFIFFLP